MILNATFVLASGSGESAFVVFAVLAAALIGGGLAVWAIQRAFNRRRTDGMKTATQEIGFTFEGDEWADLRHAPMLETALFGKGHSEGFRNIVTGSRSGMKASLFDYALRVGSGKNSHTEAQTVGTFVKEGIYLPYFDMRPNKPFDRVVDAVTHKNIHFESNPEFAKHCFLKSPLEKDVRLLFTPALLTYLEQLDSQKKWSIEGTGNTLVIYRSRKRVAPTELREFLDETSSIANSFFSLANFPAGANKG
jgi:hypothetical protein